MAPQVVTSENRKEFMAALIKTAPEPVEEVKAEPKPEETPPKQEAKPEEKESEVKEGERIRLKRERKEAEKQAQEAKAELERLRSELEQIKKPKTAESEKPDPAKFTDMAQYAEALADWKLDQKWREREQKEFEVRQKQEIDRLIKRWNANVKETAAAIPDYQDTVSGVDIPLTNELRDAILESDIGPRVQYYLAKHPEEVDRLTAMTIKGMERAFGKLEAKIEAEMSKQQTPAEVSLPKVAVKKPVEAPEPITPIISAGSAANGHVIDADGNVVGSYSDYKNARRAGKIR